MKIMSITKALKAITNNNIVNQTIISLDLSGNLTIEGFKKLIDYTDTMIQLKAFNKILYIYGTNINIASCTKHGANVMGNIERIEIYEGD